MRFLLYYFILILFAGVVSGTDYQGATTFTGNLSYVDGGSTTQTFDMETAPREGSTWVYNTSSLAWKSVAYGRDAYRAYVSVVGAEIYVYNDTTLFYAGAHPADDTTAIRYAASNFPCVELAANTTFSIENVSIPSGTTLRGGGPSTILTTTTDAKTLYVMGDDVVLQDFSMVGSGASSGYNNNIAIYATESSVCNIANIDISNYSAFTTMYIKGDGCDISNIDMVDNRGEILVRGEHNSFRDCAIDNGTRHGFRVLGSHNYITRARINNTPNTDMIDYVGIYILGESGGYIDDVYISDTNIENMNGGSMDTFSSIRLEYCNDSIITDTYFEYNNRTNIYITKSNNIKIVASTMLPLVGTSHYHLKTNDVDGLQVGMCIFEGDGSSWSGADLYHVSNIMIDSSIFRDGYYGICICNEYAQSDTNCRVDECSFLGQASNAISIYNTGTAILYDCAVTDSYIYGTGGHGIYVSDRVKRPMIANNNVVDCSGSQIYINNSNVEYAQIRSNVLKGTTKITDSGTNTRDTNNEKI